MQRKPFSELSDKEARTIARKIVQSSKSEQDIRRLLTEAGFNGNAASINIDHGGPFPSRAFVFGPQGQTMRV